MKRFDPPKTPASGPARKSTRITAARNRSMLYERLEDRVLFDAVPDASLYVDAEEATNVEQSNAERFDASLYAEDVKVVADPSLIGQTEEPHAAEVRQELVIVDTSVDNYLQLVQDLLNQDDPGREFEIALINGTSDGIAQVTDALSQHNNLDAVHIISHGDETGVRLGDVWLTQGNLGGYAAEIAQWSTAFTEGGDLLFLGCDLAATADGRGLLQSISMLTGADVAASTDDTGYAPRGGDWDLEHIIGEHETSIAFSEELQSTWQGLLAPSAEATLSVPAEVPLGEDVNFTVSFQNTGPSGDVGYGPFIDILIPHLGEDGVYDGGSYTSAQDGLDVAASGAVTYLGLPVNYQVFTIPDADGAGGLGIGAVTHPYGESIQNETQLLGMAGSVTGGTFTLSFGGNTTASIAWNANAATVQSRLEALGSIGSGNVSVTGSLATGEVMAIEFTGILATSDQALVTTDGSSLSGGGDAQVQGLTDGAATAQATKIYGRAGDKLVVAELPFGSFTPEQPAAVISVNATMSTSADLNQPLTIRSRGGFRYGTDALNNPDTDGTLFSDSQSNASNWVEDASVTPTLMTISKTSTAPEQETATGPNYVRQWTVSVDIPDGQTITDLDIFDDLPDNIVFLSLDSITSTDGGTSFTSNVPSGNNILGTSTNLTAHTGANSYGTMNINGVQSAETLVVTADSVTGTAADEDIIVTFSFYVEEIDANTDRVIPLSGEDDTTSTPDSRSHNNARVLGDWTPTDVRDAGGTNNAADDPAGFEDTIDDKSIAIQKSVTVVDGTGTPTGATNVVPGSILQYTLSFQISDYYTYGDIVLTDTFSDGQQFYSPLGPTFSVSDFNASYSGSSFNVHVGAENTATSEAGTDNFIVDRSEIDHTDNGAENPATDGTTTITIELSERLQQLADDGVLQGGLTNGATNLGAATGTITYYTQVQDEFADVFLSGDRSVDQGDVLSNDVTIAGTVRENEEDDINASLFETLHTESDTSSASIMVAQGVLTKAIYAVNGSTSFGSVVDAAPGDEITYRLTYTLPTTDFEDLVITDFFPLPVFDVADADADGTPAANWTFDPDQSSNQLLPGVVEVMAINGADGDTFYDVWDLADDSMLNDSVAPTLSIDTNANSLKIDYGTFDNTGFQVSQVDLLVTVTVQDDPFADGLFLTNQAQATEGSTNGDPADAVDLVQIRLTEPVINGITKGVVDSSKTTAYSAGSVTFAETGSTADFSGANISSDWLANNTIDTLITNLDAGDTARFAVVVENTGSSRTGAFDVTIADTLDAGLTYVSGSLRVYDGSGAALTYSGSDTDLFAGGIVLDDPGATTAQVDGTDGGALDAYHATSGRNVAVLVYDVTIDSTAEPLEQLDNTATLQAFAGQEGGQNHVLTPPEAVASVSLINVSASKTIVGTSEAHTTFVGGVERVAVGEIVRYRIELAVPEGTSSLLTLRDKIPTGLTYIDDGTATVAFVSDSGTMSSSTLSGGGLNATDTGTISDITPTFVLPDLATSESDDPGVENDTWSSGNDVYFKLGTVVNDDSDADTEYVVIEFNALVDNNASPRNDAGEYLYNDLEVLIDQDGSGTLSTSEEIYDLPDGSRPRVRVSEPLIQNLNKSVNFPTGDAGDTVTYTITFDVASGNEYTDAFDVDFTDIVPTNLTYVGASLTVNVDGTLQTAGVDYTDNSSGSNLAFRVDQLARGASVSVTYQATIDTGVNATDVITNRANVTWSSLPGDFGTDDGTGGNATGSDLASLDDLDTGGSASPEYNTKTGETQGERDGSGQNDPADGGDDTEPNDLHSTATTDVTVAGTSISKTLDGTSIDDSGTNGNNVADEAVIGEIATYTVTLNFSEATLPNAMLVDNLDSGLVFVGVTGFTVTDVTLDGSVNLTTPVVTNSGRTITWDLQIITDTTPGDAQGGGDSDGEITITYEAIVTNVSSNQAAVQLNNSVNFQWDDDGLAAPNPRESVTANAANLTVIEPSITVTKDVALDTDADTFYDDGKMGDAGDAVQYTLTLQNLGGVDAFDIEFSDALPTVSGGSSAILTPSFSVTDNATSGAVSAADFELVGDNSTGWTLQKRSGVNIDMLASQVDGGGSERLITFTVTGTIASSVFPNQQIVNTAAVEWTSTDGTLANPSSHTTSDTERTGADGAGGGNLNNYEATSSDTFSINAPTFTKTLFATDQTETSGTNVTIGETATYAILVSLPEGVIPDTTVVDQLPAGLDYTNVQIITTAAASLDYLGTPLLANDFAGTIAGGTPSVSGGIGDGVDVTFTFGQIDVTVDNDMSNNAFLILVDALVLDVATNTGYVGNQQVLSNGATIDFSVDAQPPQSATPVDVTVVESSLTITKEFGPTVDVDLADAGDNVSIVLTVDNTGGTSPAYDVVIEDVLSATDYDRSTVSVGFSGTDYPSDFTASYNSGTGELRYSGGTIAAGATVTFTFTVDLQDTPLPGATLTNTATITDSTSLQGTESDERNDPDPDGDSSDSDDDTIRIRTNSLSGFVWTDTDNDGVFDGGETGISGADVQLVGTDHLSNAVDVTVQTVVGGGYSFTGLRPGTYTIIEDPAGTTVPGSLLDGIDTIGTPGGVDTTNDQFSSIVLPTGAETSGTNNNFGEIQPASVSGAVYDDADNDGVFDGAESGIDGIAVRISGTDDLGNAVSSTVITAGGGLYSFTNLRPSNGSGYTITELTEPAGYLDGQETDGSLANGDDTSVNNSISSINVVPGDAGTSYNFGEIQPTTLSGAVYHDADNDGVFDGSETGIDGINVRITGTDDLGNAVDITVATAGGGLYSFSNLRPSNGSGYTITEMAEPTGYLDGQDTDGSLANGDDTSVNNQISSINVVPGTTGTSYNFGEVLPASLSGAVYYDADNDGTFDGSESGIDGVSVRLTGNDDLGNAVDVTVATAGGGLYTFTNLRPSDGTGYIITETTEPAGYIDGMDTDGSLANGDDSTVNNQISSINLSSGDTGTSYNFGEVQSASLSGAVYYDADNDGVFDGSESGIDGVSVRITGTDDLGNTVDVTVATAGGGLYTFANLRPSDGSGYTITELADPVGYLDGMDSDGSLSNGDDTTANDTISSINVDSADAGTSYNFGELQPVSLSGAVYNDADNDGVFDGSESGIDGVNVRITGTDDLGNAVDITMATAGGGLYTFSNLRPSDGSGYTITETTEPTGYLDGQDTDGSLANGDDSTVNNSISSINVVAGNTGTSYNFGEIQPTSLSGAVYHDADNDGTFDGSESGIDGVNVRITGTDDLGNTVDATIATAGGGLYTFSNLRPSDGSGYTITEMTEPTGYFDGMDTDGSLANGDDSSVNNQVSSINVVPGNTGTSYNFGEVLPASLSGAVYHDANNDGTFDGSESGIDGVSVRITGNDDLGNAVDVTVATAGGGLYTFANLRPSDATGYTIAESTEPTGYFDGMDTDGSLANGDDSTVNNQISSINLSSGNAGASYNFGEVRPASIAGAVYHDADNDGVFDGSESGIDGVNVRITGTDDLGNSVDVTVATAGGGLYTFANLRPSDGTGYTVTELTEPTGYIDGIDTDGSLSNGDDSTVNNQISSINLSSDDTAVSYNFGEVQPASISGAVYNDADNDGVFDGSESGIDGVNVRITGTDDLGNAVNTTVSTAGGGIYTFNNLRPSDANGYTITELANPTGYLDGQDTDGSLANGDDTTVNDQISSVNIVSGNAGTSYNFGEVAPVSLSGAVYHDADNDGVFDGAESGIDGVSVRITGTDDLGNTVDTTVATAGGGLYAFNNLRPADLSGYTITETTEPTGYLDGIDTDGSLANGNATSVNNRISGINVVPGDTGTDYNFGEVQAASLSGAVYHDADNDGVFDGTETGIDGINVRITGTDDLGNVIDITQTTAGGGLYTFSNLRPSNLLGYTVTELTEPTGYFDGQDTDGSLANGDATTVNNQISSINVVSGNAGVNYDFGELLPASVSGAVYNDADNDGVFDGSESGIDGISVRIVGTDDLGNALNTTVLTAGGGLYSFTNLRPSDSNGYTVTELTEPSGYLDGIDTDGSLANGDATTVNNQISSINVASNNAAVDYNFGEVQPVSLSGAVYYDADNDGVFDGSESGIDGINVRVTGTDDIGNIVDVTIATAGGGLYSFTNLRPSDAAGYTITELTEPTGYIDGQDTDGSLANGDDSTVNNQISSINAAPGDNGTSYNFGEILPASLSGAVYHDANNDGTFDGSESGIDGINVRITGNDDLGNAVDVTVATAGGGLFTFANLRPSDGSGYTVTELTEPTGYLDGIDTDGSLANGDATTVNNRISSIDVSSADAGTSYNFGEVLPASLSGAVYHDADNDGVFDGSESGIDGINVRITGTDDLGNTVDVTVATAGGGLYTFANLRPSDSSGYTITELTEPAGYLDGKDTDGSLTNGDAATINNQVSSINVVSGDTGTSYNFGEVQPASLSGAVYYDADNDGVFDGSESGIDGVNVRITGTDDLGNTVDVTVATAGGGLYTFSNLRPSDATGYTLTELTEPAGYLDGKDSDGSLANGDATAVNNQVSSIQIVSGDSGTSYNFGELLPVTLSGAVYNDADNDGVFDGTESGIDGVNVRITGTDDLGSTVDTTVATAGGGLYSFSNLRPADVSGYTITETTEPAGFLDGIDTDGSLANGDATSVNNRVSSINVVPGDNGTSYNFGEIQAVSLSGAVYSDANNNGVFDGTESGIDGVSVRITGTDDLGNTVDITVATAGGGLYAFNNLRPDDGAGYTITETTEPTGYLDGRDRDGSLSNGDATSVNNRISSINTAPADSGVNYDFGELQPASISGAVYHDADNDGTFDGTESGIDGINVQLTGTDDLGNTVDITVATAGGGLYTFSNLRPSDAAGYTVTELAEPTGYLDGIDTDGSLANGDATTVNNRISSINILPGNAGVSYVFGEVQPSTLSGYVYHDSDNDGDRSDEPVTSGIQGSQIRLTGNDDLGNAVSQTIATDTNGYWEFTGLRPSSLAGYTITQLSAPMAYFDGIDTIGTPGGNSATNEVFSAVVVTSGTDGTENDFGEVLPASLSGTVFNDHDADGNFEPGDGDTGISGVTIQLTGTDDVGNAVNLSLMTGSNGTYQFSNLRPSNGAGYVLTETHPIAYNDGIDSDGSLANGDTSTNDTISSINVGSNDDGTGYNFAETGSYISGVVFVDDSRDGSLDGSEIVRVAGVTVELFDLSGGPPVSLGTVTTGSDGAYRFDYLPAGDYRVVETQPTQYGNSSPNTINLTMPLTGSTDNNFGEVLYDIGDTIYFDANNNGVQDGSEQGIANVDVTLQSAGVDGIFGNTDDPAAVSTATNASGAYSFTELFNANYQVTVDQTDLPVGMTGTDETDDPAFGTAAINGTSHMAIANADRFDIDFGYTGVLSIGDTFWHDVDGDGTRNNVDSNNDGTPDTPEPGIGGVTVNLVFAGADNSFTATGDNLTLSTTTAADGTYSFANLPEGEFRISYACGDIPTGLTQTIETDDSAAAVDGTANISLATNRVDVDFGFLGEGSIGDTVFFDADNDGSQDDGSGADPAEPGLIGVAVELDVDYDSDTNIDYTLRTVTDANGNYEFDNLSAATYTVRVLQPAGTVQTFDADGTGTANQSSLVLAASEDNTDQDFGYTGTGTIFDTVFFDINDDAIDDTATTDRGLPAVDVTLSIDLDNNGSVDYSRTMPTDSDGDFIFTNLIPGTYTITTDGTDMAPGLANNPTVDNDGLTTPHEADYTVGIGESVTGTGFGFHAVPDYEITKTGDFTSAAPGDTVQYTIIVTNIGELDGRNVQITDNFPTNVLAITDASGGTVDTGAGTIVWDLAAMAPSEQVVLTVTATVHNSVAAGIDDFTNSVSVDDDHYNGDDPDTSNNDASYPGTLNAAPEYSITKSNGGTITLSPGDQTTYTIAVTNNGNQDGTGVVVTDRFPTDVLSVADAGGGTVDTGAGTVTWTVGNLDVGDTVFLNISFDVINPAMAGLEDVVNPADVHDDGTNGADPIPANNTTSDTDPLTAVPDYRITKTLDGSPTFVEPGQIISYSLFVENIGDQGGTGVVVTDTFPTELLTDITAAGATIDLGAGTITWNVGALAGGGESVLLTVSATVRDTVPSGQELLINAASVTDDLLNGPDPDLTNNDDDDTTTLTAQPDLTITKTDGGVENVNPGKTVVYTINYANVGNQDSVNVVITENLPDGSSFSTVDSTTGWVDNTDGTFSFNIASLNAGDGGTIEFAVIVDDVIDPNREEIINVTSITDDGSNGPDPTPLNNVAEDDTPLLVFAFDSFQDQSGHSKDLDTFNNIIVHLPHDDQFAHRLRPLPVDTVYTGIVDPGTTLSGKIYDQEGRLVGEQTVVADSAGNWLMQFPTVVMYEQPHEMRVDQTLAVQNSTSFAGFNLRRFFHPAIHSQLYMNEPLNVGAAFRHDPHTVLQAIHAANNDPLGFNWTHHAYELVVSSSNTSAM